MKKFIAFIPARRGSKRIRKKNFIRIKGLPLYKHTLNAAKKSKLISNIIISTDAKQILREKNEKNIKVIERPKYLCKDDSSTESALLHAFNSKKKLINSKDKIFIVLLQPTSPLRNAKDIDNSIKYFKKKKFDTMFSGYEKKILIWKKIGPKVSPLNYSMKIRKRGQNTKKIIIENGAIFIFPLNKFLKLKNRLFKKIGFFPMCQKNSFELDTNEDLKTLKSIIN